jgi:hypothetical protein
VRASSEYRYIREFLRVDVLPIGDLAAQGQVARQSNFRRSKPCVDASC